MIDSEVGDFSESVFACRGICESYCCRTKFSLERFGRIRRYLTRLEGDLQKENYRQLNRTPARSG